MFRTARSSPAKVLDSILSIVVVVHPIDEVLGAAQHDANELGDDDERDGQQRNLAQDSPHGAAAVRGNRPQQAGGVRPRIYALRGEPAVVENDRKRDESRHDDHDPAGSDRGQRGERSDDSILSGNSAARNHAEQEDQRGTDQGKERHLDERGNGSRLEGRCGEACSHATYRRAIPTVRRVSSAAPSSAAWYVTLMNAGNVLAACRSSDRR